MEVFKPAERRRSHLHHRRVDASVWTRDSHALLHDVGVNPGHAVDGVRAQHAQMGHVDALGLALLDERHPPQTLRVAGEPHRDGLAGRGARPSERESALRLDRRSSLTSRCLWLIS